jgi:hypothetical protein
VVLVTDVFVNEVRLVSHDAAVRAVSKVGARIKALRLERATYRNATSPDRV